MSTVDPRRTICPSTQKTCHSLQGCRFSSCFDWSGYGLLLDRSYAPACEGEQMALPLFEKNHQKTFGKAGGAT